MVVLIEVWKIFQIFENDFRKSLEINKRKAEPEGFEPSPVLIPDDSGV